MLTQTVYVARGFPWMKALALLVLVLWLFHAYFVEPLLRGIDEMTPWEGALPFIACGEEQQPEVRPAMGFDAMWYDLGAGVRKLAAGPPKAEEMRGWFRKAGHETAETYALVRAGADGKPRPLGLVPEGPPAVTQVSGDKLSDVEVAELARAVGWPEAEITMVVARVKAESGGDPQAKDYVDGTHQGLLQMGLNEQRAYMPGEDPFDPRANLRGARKLWEDRGWQPWRASDSGARKHLEAGQRAAALGGVAPKVQPVDCGDVLLASAGDLTPANAAEAELSRNAIAARRAILATFPGTEIGGWGTRPSGKTEHDDRDHTGKKAARALDVMTYEDMAKGERVAQWVRANWDELRVGYLIWNRQIWFSPDSSKPYRGASPHTDHPHITFMTDGENV